MCDSVKWDIWELDTLKRSRTCGWLQSVNISKLGLFLKFCVPGLKFQPLKQTRGIILIVVFLKGRKSVSGVGDYVVCQQEQKALSCCTISRAKRSLPETQWWSDVQTDVYGSHWPDLKLHLSLEKLFLASDRIQQRILPKYEQRFQRTGLDSSTFFCFVRWLRWAWWKQHTQSDGPEKDSEELQTHICVITVSSEPCST